MKRQTKNNIKMCSRRDSNISHRRAQNLFLYIQMRRRLATMHYKSIGHYAVNVGSYGKTVHVAADSNKCSELRTQRNKHHTNTRLDNPIR